MAGLITKYFWRYFGEVGCFSWYIQGVVSTIPKKSSNFQIRFARKQMISSLKFILSQNQDQGATRLMETTPPCSMEIN